MTISKFIFKAQRRLWNYLVCYTRNMKIYPWIYHSFWHYKFSKDKATRSNTCYYSAMPNTGAGIGHQLANWIAGYWFAKQFDLKFAHIPFSTHKWETFLGFGEGEVTVKELLNKGYKVIRLPLFDELNNKEVEMTKAIIKSYANRQVVFIAEQDQYYENQYGAIDDIKYKFEHASNRHNDQIIFDSTHFNIAVHVRRTVIIDNKMILEDDTARAKRWLSNDYYEKVLKQVVETISVTKPISIYLFSTGKPSEFEEFAKYGDVHFCSDMDEYASFLHLVRADLLITSKSSFSYKPALMNENTKICPRNFWHSYPETKDWILVENDGTFDTTRLKSIL